MLRCRADVMQERSDEPCFIELGVRLEIPVWVAFVSDSATVGIDAQ